MAIIVSAVGLISVPCASAAKPKLRVADATATEGGTLNFAVSVKPKINEKIKVGYATQDGTAGGSDFTPATATLKIKPNKKGATISIPTVGDAADEADETLTLRLLNPKHAKLADGTAVGTIIDDDTSGGGGGDGGGGGGDGTGGGGDGTGGGGDGTGGGTGGGCTGCPTVSLSGSPAVNELNPPDFTLNINLDVSLSAPSASDVTVNWALAGGTASANDLEATSGTVTIPAGQTARPLTLRTAHDYVEEPNETATIAISQPVNAVLGTTQTTMTILDDDFGVGDLLISEFMPNPSAVDDNVGEWIELTNLDTDPGTVNLAGLEIRRPAPASCTLTGTLIGTGARVLVARSANPGANGSLPTVDVVCSMPLLDTTDTLSVVIPNPSTVLDTITYPSTTAGRSWNLDPESFTATGNDDFVLNWCLAAGSYGLGDKGTPKAANEPCP